MSHVPRNAGLLLALAACLASGAASADTTRPAGKTDTEELRVVVARRLRSVTGTDARIRDLRYELLSSTFVGKGIELGPRGHPYVRLPEVTVELALLSSASSLTVARLQARGARIAIPAAWLGSPFPFLPHRPLTLRAGELTHAELVLLESGKPGGLAKLRDLTITLADIELTPGARGAVRLKGTLTLTAAKLQLGSTVVLEGLRLEGKLAGERLVVTRLSARCPDGTSSTVGPDSARSGRDPTIVLAGSIGLKGARLGAVDLSGKVNGLPLGSSGSAELHGRLAIKGPAISTLTVEAKLRSRKGAPPRSGLLEGAPPFKLRGSIGGRTVRGTLDSWQLK